MLVYFIKEKTNKPVSSKGLRPSLRDKRNKLVDKLRKQSLSWVMSTIFLWDILIIPSYLTNTPLSYAQKMRHSGPKTDTNMVVTFHKRICISHCRYLGRACDLTLPTMQQNLKNVMFSKCYIPEDIPPALKTVLAPDLKDIFPRRADGYKTWWRPSLGPGAEIYGRMLEIRSAGLNLCVVVAAILRPYSRTQCKF